MVISLTGRECFSEPSTTSFFVLLVYSSSGKYYGIILCSNDFVQSLNACNNHCFPPSWILNVGDGFHDMTDHMENTDDVHFGLWMCEVSLLNTGHCFL